MEPTHVNLTTAREWMTWLREKGILSEPAGAAAAADLDAAIERTAGGTR
jgi:hypothetical protein